MKKIIILISFLLVAQSCSAADQTIEMLNKLGKEHMVYSKKIAKVIIKPPIIVLVVGTSLIPKIGSQTRKIPPKTSVKDNKVRSAAGKFLEPIE